MTVKEKRNCPTSVGPQVARSMLALVLVLAVWPASAYEHHTTEKTRQHRNAQQGLPLEFALEEGLPLDFPLDFFQGPKDPLPTPTSTPSAPTPTSTPTATTSPSMSSHPTNTESSIPSDIPSDAPSQIPSASSIPSVIPSDAPSQIPSFGPSPDPTLESDVPSDVPSLTPTRSLRPSSSSMPSDIPSFMPSPAPSSPPSSSLEPSSLPSSQPTDFPTAFPSLPPSGKPSVPPTPEPSPSPSEFPTSKPSSAPTPAPSRAPSETPSDVPTSPPSSMPSGHPTLACHNKFNYRSPINDLTCDDHEGTDCVQWRVLGLNTTELGDLIESCPETCNIPCGAFTQFSISLTFRLSGIPGLLDSASKKTLEVAAFDFVMIFLRSEEPNTVFELDKVELTSQSLFTPSERRLRRRRLQQEEFVEVSVLFGGFTIGLTDHDVTELLVAGIKSPSYTSSLQRSDVFYTTAVISSASEAIYVDRDDIKDEGRTGPSKATVVVSTLISVCTLFFAVGTLINHRRSGKWVPRLKLPNLRDSRLDNEEHPYLSQTGSPRTMGSMLSFDGTPAGTSTLGRLIASLSLSRSKSSTEADDSASHESSGPAKYPRGIQIVSPMSDETEDSILQEHPLADIIPPMIVIDNLDDGNYGSAELHKNNQQFPSRRLEASSALVSALNDCRNVNPSSSFAGMVYNASMFASELSISLWSDPNENTNRVMSPVGIIVDSDSDDDVSIASTPVHSKTPKTPTLLRRSRSFSALESVERRKDTSPFSSGVLDIGYPSCTTPNMSSGEASNDDKWSLASGSDDDEEEEASLDIAFQPEPLQPIAASFSSASDWHLPPKPPSTPDKAGRKASSPIEGGKFINSLRSLSPIKAFKESVPRSSRRHSLPMLGDFGLKIRKSSNEASDHSDDDPTGLSNVSTSDSLGNDNCIRCEFEASRKGQLGLVIESNRNTGPIVHAVKDYSPLFGLVKKGDKIVEVDGRKTSQSTLTEVTKLLAVRPGRRSSNLRIVVVRSRELNASHSIPSASHTRDNSHGSSSIASSKMLEDVEAVTGKDDLVKSSFCGDQGAAEQGEI